jgi:hypothetical protein
VYIARVCNILSRYVAFVLILKVEEEEEVDMEVAAEVIGNVLLSV